MECKENRYQCIMSVGIRCFTEIFLKNLNLKKFSGPFDGMFNTSLDAVVNILKNGIQEEDLIYSENITNDEISLLNKKHGFRTMHKNINYSENDITSSYHLAFLPHHNLNNNETKKHFKRCFERIEKIKLHKIQTLFCLFIHPQYGGDKDIPYNEIVLLKNYLVENFQCDLLVCKFEEKYGCNYSWKTILNNENIIYIHINNNSHLYGSNEIVLKEIFSSLAVIEKNLLTYEEINKLV